jgi:stage V sporulation protein S
MYGARVDVIKVSGSSRTSAVAGAIAGVFREHKRAEVQAIGAGAVNQAVKALVLARGYLKEDGYDVICSPEFVDVEIEGKVRTAIKISVESRSGTQQPPEPPVEPVQSEETSGSHEASTAE